MLIPKLTDSYHIAVRKNDRTREKILKDIINKSEQLKKERKIKVSFESETAITNEVIIDKYKSLKEEASSCPIEEKEIYETKLAIIKEYLPKTYNILI